MFRGCAEVWARGVLPQAVVLERSGAPGPGPLVLDASCLSAIPRPNHNARAIDVAPRPVASRALPPAASAPGAASTYAPGAASTGKASPGNRAASTGKASPAIAQLGADGRLPTAFAAGVCESRSTSPADDTRPGEPSRRARVPPVGERAPCQGYLGPEGPASLEAGRGDAATEAIIVGTLRSLLSEVSALTTEVRLQRREMQDLVAELRGPSR